MGLAIHTHTHTHTHTNTPCTGPCRLLQILIPLLKRLVVSTTSIVCTCVCVCWVQFIQCFPAVVAFPAALTMLDAATTTGMLGE